MEGREGGREEERRLKLLAARGRRLEGYIAGQDEGESQDCGGGEGSEGRPILTIIIGSSLSPSVIFRISRSQVRSIMSV